MKIWNITQKDLLIFIKDRSALVMLFLLPFVFIVATASLSGRSNEESREMGARLNLVVVNEDVDSGAAGDIINGLQQTGKLEIITQGRQQTEAQLNASTLRLALFIPPGFSADIAAGKQANLHLKLHPLANQDDLMTVERNLARVVREYLMMGYLDQGLKQMAAMQAANPDAAAAFSETRLLQQVDLQKAQAAQRPLIRVRTVNAVEEKPNADLPGIGQTTVLGMAVLFVFLGAQNTALSIFREKKYGSFRRLMAAPVHKAALLAGKLLPNVILGLIQTTVIVLTGGYFIKLLGLKPLDFSSDPFGLVVTGLAAVLCAASLGLCIVSLAKTESQVGGLSSMLLFVAGLLSGSFIPMFLFPEGLANLARLLPQYWANEAFYSLVFRGQTLATIWPHVAILMVFALAFFGIGLWRFKFE